MKSPVRLSAVFLVASLCVSPFLPGRVWSAKFPSSPNNSAATQSSGAATAASSTSSAVGTIPGPLRSFLRMAGVSQQVSPEEVLPLLAHNVAALGYPDSSGEGGKPTEFLTLLKRYLDQARELRVLAGPDGVLRFSNCDQAQPLLAILGYRLKQACGPNTSVEAYYAERAFLTIDSGFPLADVEQALREGKPFAYPFPSSPVPLLFTPNDWTVNGQNDKGAKKDVLDSLLGNPALARLYWALSRIDSETGNALRQSPGLVKLLPYASVLDFYGSQIYIRSGRVGVPGGPSAESGWKDLVGASPEAPSDFVAKLLVKDEGWLAAYFDALSRVSQTQQAYFTESQRLQRFYAALRGLDISPSPSRHSFRPDPGLLLLLTRLQLEPNGEPHVPGNLDVWKEILTRGRKSDSKTAQAWAKRASGVNSPDQLVEAMFAFSRVSSSNGPLADYLMLNEIDRGRSANQRLSPQTARLLVDKFPRFNNQYLIFSEFRALNNASITLFLNTAEGLDRILDRTVRADALGIFQANVGLWQILARQGQIANESLNDSWQGVISPFANVLSSSQLYDAGRTSLRAVSRAASGNPDLSEDEIVALLAGPSQTSSEGQQERQDLATRMRAVLDDQRLVSLDTIFGLGDGLNQMAGGKPAGADLIPLAAGLREFEMPRPLFTTRERAAWAAGLYNVRHTTAEMRTDLTKVISAPGTPAEFAVARGELTPFLRDTLVGLNYAYYEPPGAQMLHDNPLFVRSHDFSGQLSVGTDQSWQTPILFGRGGTASGGAHLAGSLADLPYVLADMEQNFIIPKNLQSLIWEDLVPALLTNATLPRWWGVTQNELHAVTLYQRTGEEILSAAAGNEQLRQAVMNILSDRLLPQRSEAVEIALRAGQTEQALAQVMPSETFYLAAEYRRKFSGETNHWGAAGNELENLSRSNPGEVSWERLSKDFGVPHPALAQNYTRELLNLKPFPTFMGYSSRLMAESWESNNLYWARLADEMGYSPVMLNRLVPELTRRMVENLLATHTEDWPAVLRAMRETGEEFRGGKIASLPKSGTVPRL